MSAAVRALSALLVVSACTSAAPAPSPSLTEQPARGGRLVVAWAGTERMNWLQPAITGSTPIASLVYETFAQFDVVTGELRMGFGAVSQSSDGRTYVVELDPRAVWSDGQPIVALDWVTSLKAAARTKAVGPLEDFSEITEIVGFADYAAGRSDDIRGVRADGRTLTVTLQRVLCRASGMFGVLPPLPTHIFGKYLAHGGPGVAEAPENLTAPVSSGPFVLREWRRGDGLIFARNDRYWRGPALLDEWVWKLVSPGKELEELKRGAVDGIVPGVADVPILQQMPSVTLNRSTGPRYTYIGWSTQSDTLPALRDKRVRQALAHGFDMDLAAREIHPYAVRIHSTIPAGSWSFASVKGPAHDVTRARELLAAAGYVSGQAGLERDGRPLEIRIAVATATHSQRLAQLAVDGYARLGIRTTLTAASAPHRLLLDGQVDAIVGQIVFYHPDPDQRLVWHSSAVPGPDKAGAFNFMRFASAEVDALLDDAGSPQSGDCSLARRAPIYARVAQLLSDEQPWHFGFATTNFEAMPSRLRGQRFGPYGYLLNGDVHKWWLAPEKK